MVVQIVGEVLRHSLGQRGHQHPLPLGDGGADLAEQVVHLRGCRPHDHLRVHETGGPHHLLHHLPRHLRLVVRRSGGDEDRLGRQPLPLVEPQRPVVQRRRQPEAILHQRLLAGAVALVHATDLRHRDVTLVDDEQRVLRQVVEQRRRRLPRFAPGEVPGVVLDAVAVTQLLDHLEIEAGSLFQALRLHQLVVLVQVLQPLPELVPDLVDHRENALPRGHVVGLGKDRVAGQAVDDLAGERVEHRDALDLVIEQLDPHRLLLRLRGEDVHDVAANPVGAALEHQVVARVLKLRQPGEDVALVNLVAPVQVQNHAQVRLRVSQAVDGRHRGDDDGVPPLQQRLGGGEPHLLDVRVDRRILLDVGVRGGHVGFRLVVVVIGDEVLHRVVGEEFLELAVELRGQGLVRRQHQGRPLHRLDHVGDGEGLAGAGDSQEGLMGEPGFQAVHQRGDRGGLVAGGLVARHDFEFG